MFTLLIAVWPLEDDTFEINLVSVKFDHTYDFVKKKTTQPELPSCTLQSFPAKLFDSTYRFVPLYGKFCDTRQTKCMRSPKTIFGVFEGMYLQDPGD